MITQPGPHLSGRPTRIRGRCRRPPRAPCTGSWPAGTDMAQGCETHAERLDWVASARRREDLWGAKALVTQPVRPICRQKRVQHEHACEAATPLPPDG